MTTSLVLHQLFFLLPKGITMLPPSSLLPSPSLHASVLPGPLNVLHAQEDLGEALVQELVTARELWETATSKSPIDRGATDGVVDNRTELVAARRTAAMRSDLAAAKLLTAAITVWPDCGRNKSMAGTEGRASNLV